MSEVITVTEKQLVVVAGDSPSVIEVTEEHPIIEVANTGPQGPPGPAGTDKNYEQQFTAQSTIIVTHNLGKKPSVTVIDSAGDEVVGDVEYDSMNQLTVRFLASFSGTVICN